MSVEIHPPSILLADGDEQSRLSLGSFFEGHGWRYEVVRDPSAMVGALERGKFDLVIADIEIAGADSIKFFKEILQRDPSQAVIALSPSASYDDALTYFRNGATDLLARPIDFSWLERVVQQIIFSRRNDERERATYRYVTKEEAEMRFSSADLAALSSVSLPIVSRLVSSGEILEAEALKLRLAVQEAVLNGFEHGNLELDSRWKEDVDSDGRDKFTSIRNARIKDPAFSQREVVVRLVRCARRLEITVKDEGKGFLNDGAFPGAGAIDSLSCSGRGLSLMSSAVDEVRFGANGSEVTLIKLLHERGFTEDYGAKV